MARRIAARHGALSRFNLRKLVQVSAHGKQAGRPEGWHLAHGRGLLAGRRPSGAVAAAGAFRIGLRSATTGHVLASPMSCA